jgi:hypothetical protein
MKRDLSSETHNAIEKDWLAKWGAKLGNPMGTLRQVLCAYIKELDTTVRHLNESIDWDCWDDNDIDIPINASA